MKQKIKTGLFLTACIVCVAILWKHTHLEPGQKQARTGQNQTKTAKNEKGQKPDVPKEYKEKVSKQLSFDAVVDIGDADLGRIGCRAAVMQEFDEESVKKCFLNPDVHYDVSESREMDWEEKDVVSKIYEKEGSDFLTVWKNGFRYSKIPFIWDIDTLMSAVYGSKELNYQYQFSKDLELDGFSRQDAWDKVVERIGQQGIEQKRLKIAESYMLDTASMDRQEKKLIEEGLIDTKIDPGHGKWRRSEEGYFFFIEECVDGLPLVPAKTMTDMGNSWFYPTKNMAYIIRDGVTMVRLCDWFEAGQAQGYYTLAPFDDIAGALKAKYENRLKNEYVCIEKMKLYLYPVSKGKESFQLYPVWICTERIRMSEKDKISREEMTALDAVTGEELEDLK